MSDSLGTFDVQVAARDLKVGDVLVLPGGRRRRIATVEGRELVTGRDPGARIWIVVEGSTSQAWENRASAAKGASSIALERQGLRPFHPDELVLVERDVAELEP